MAELLGTHGSSFNIEQVITEAKERIVLVTPFLKLTDTIFSRIRQADRRGVKIIFLYGKEENQKDIYQKLSQLANCNIYFLKNLHAKCFFNEYRGIITSMNLYEYSQVNNWELGIAVNYEDDEYVFEKLMEEVDVMIESSTCQKENFKHSVLIKKPLLQQLCDYLNIAYKTDKFVFEKEHNEYSRSYDHRLIAKGFPNDTVNIESTNNSIQIMLNLKETTLKKMNTQIDLEQFSDEYRVYINRLDTISIYNSIHHRDKWNTYSDKIKVKYLARGINRVLDYIVKLISETKIDR